MARAPGVYPWLAMSNPRYTTRFTASAKVYHPSLQEKKEALASLDQLKGLLPADIVPENDLDIVYIVGNLAVAGLLNLNDDGVTMGDALACYQRFERRQCNIEHNRKQIVGYIVKAGLSEFGTDRLITEDEARAAGEPFNIVTVAAIWKVADQDLCNFILQSAAPGSPDKDALSLSFEVGFNDYSIVVLPGSDTVLSQAVRLISHESSAFDQYDKLLRVNGGSGRMSSKGGSPDRVGRILSPPLLPLGQGVVTVPAAAVKGITPVLTQQDGQDWADEEITKQDESPVYTEGDPMAANSRIEQFVASIDALSKSVEAFRDMTQTKATTRIQLSPTLQEQAKTLQYPKADVILSDGTVLKNVTIFNGRELELDKDLALPEGVTVTSMTPIESHSLQVDDAPNIHPNIDQVFPTRTPEGSEKADADEARKEVLRNMPYTDAILKHLEAAARILRIIGADSGVSSSTTTSTPQSLSSMKLEDLKQLEAKVKAAKNTTEMTEAIASYSTMVEEIMKASEQYAKNAALAEEGKKKAEKDAEDAKAAAIEAKKMVDDMKKEKDADKAEAKFQERMSVMASSFDLDDEARAYIVTDIRSCSDDASFDKYLSRAKKLFKAKATIETKNEKTADDLNSKNGAPGPKIGSQTPDSQDTHDTEPAIKHGDSETPHSSDISSAKKADKKDKADDGDEDDACMAAKKAIASAKSNPVDKLDLDPMGDVVTPTLAEQMRKAFAENTSIGGRKVGDLIASKKK